MRQIGQTPVTSGTIILQGAHTPHNESRMRACIKQHGIQEQGRRRLTRVSLLGEQDTKKATEDTLLQLNYVEL